MIGRCSLGSAIRTVHRTVLISAPRTPFLLSQLRGECPSLDMPPSHLAAVHGGVGIEMNSEHMHTDDIMINTRIHHYVISYNKTH